MNKRILAVLAIVIVGVGSLLFLTSNAAMVSGLTIYGSAEKGAFIQDAEYQDAYIQVFVARAGDHYVLSVRPSDSTTEIIYTAGTAKNYGRVRADQVVVSLINTSTVYAYPQSSWPYRRPIQVYGFDPQGEIPEFPDIDAASNYVRNQS